MAVAAQILLLVGKARDAEDANDILSEAIASGRALAKFREWIGAQGGDARVVDDYSLLPQAHWSADVRATRGGYILGLDALAVGNSAMSLGAGRQKKGDRVEAAVRYRPA